LRNETSRSLAALSLSPFPLDTAEQHSLRIRIFKRRATISVMTASLGCCPLRNIMILPRCRIGIPFICIRYVNSSPSRSFSRLTPKSFSIILANAGMMVRCSCFSTSHASSVSPGCHAPLESSVWKLPIFSAQVECVEKKQD
jgi:hypothetical protein